MPISAAASDFPAPQSATTPTTGKQIAQLIHGGPCVDGTRGDRWASNSDCAIRADTKQMPRGVQQSDQLPLSTWLIAPTSTSARAAGFRAVVEIGVAQIRAYLPSRPQPRTRSRLGKSVEFLSFDRIRRVDAALRVALDL